MIQKNIKVSLYALLGLAIIFLNFGSAQGAPSTSADLYSIKVKNLAGAETTLEAYKGKVLLIVNTASQCGFTPQLKDLQDLQVKYGPKGFQVLAFPSNDFQQDPGSAKESESYALSNFRITFPLFDKVSVRGPKKAELFAHLINNSPGLKTDVLWNFEKFLVGSEGKVIDRYRSPTSPSSTAVVSAIEKALTSVPQPSANANIQSPETNGASVTSKNEFPTNNKKSPLTTVTTTTLKQ